MDYGLTQENDLQIINGDFTKISDSELVEQTIALLCVTNKGDWRKSIVTGLDAIKFIGDKSQNRLIKAIEEQLKIENINYSSVRFENGKLVIQ